VSPDDDGAVREIDGETEGVGGIALRFRAWEPRAVRAGVLIVHGHGEHGGRYAATAGEFAGAGIASYAVDLRGHGRSGGRRGHAARFDHLLQDIDRFRGVVEAALPHGTPLFMLAQSMGGLIALRYLEEYASPVRGAIISSPWLATALPVPRWKRVLAPVLARVLPAVPLRTRLDPALLSHDVAAVAAYRDDPLVHDTMTPRLFAEVNRAMGDAFQRSDRIRVPLLFLLPGDDRVVDTLRSERFARVLTGGDVTVRNLDGFYHEPLNEVGRGPVLREAIDWITDRL
jgi:alpha-beta hydrolase superfamily lysophospholipase